MKLKLNENDELELKYSFRSGIYFETTSGHNLDLQNLSANDLMILFYCVFVASLQKAKRPIIDMIDFMDIVDLNGGDKCIYDFGQWYIEQVKIQWGLEEDPDDKEQVEVKGKQSFSSKKKTV